MSAWAAPSWQPLTAYLAGAVLTPTANAAQVWRCTTAGTSGASEPVWATASPWTTADGSAVWSLGTRFRQAANDGLASVLSAFAAANPGLLRKVYTERALAFSSSELPCAWVDSMNESITHSMQTRTRTMTGLTLGIVDAAPEPEVFSDRMNFIVDALVDAFTLGYSVAGASSIVQMTATADVDIPEGAVHLTGVMITLGGTFTTEGRQ